MLTLIIECPGQRETDRSVVTFIYIESSSVSPSLRMNEMIDLRNVEGARPLDSRDPTERHEAELCHTGM